MQPRPLSQPSEEQPSFRFSSQDTGKYQAKANHDSLWLFIFDTHHWFSFSYNPYDGPNDNPEVELPLTAGEYIYVYGDMDDDGFYEGLSGSSRCVCVFPWCLSALLTVAACRRADGRATGAGPL